MSEPKGHLYTAYFGELGWLCCWFAPIMRLISEQYESCHIAMNPDWAYLVEDFATVVPIETDHSEASFWEGAHGPIPEPPEGATIIRPGALWRDKGSSESSFMATGAGHFTERLWRVYGKESKEDIADILVSIRCEKYHKGALIENRDYPHREELCGLLLETGKRVASIGGPDNYHYDGMLDLRGIPMERLCGVMQEALVTVGQSSAPLHIAQLSQCPVVTWFATNPTAARPRFLEHWNPFDTPCSFLWHAEQGVHPTAVEVADNVLSLL